VRRRKRRRGNKWKRSRGKRWMRDREKGRAG